MSLFACTLPCHVETIFHMSSKGFFSHLVFWSTSANSLMQAWVWGWMKQYSKCTQRVVKYIGMLVLFYTNTCNWIAHYIAIEVRWQIPAHTPSVVWCSSWSWWPPVHSQYSQYCTCHTYSSQLQGRRNKEWHGVGIPVFLPSCTWSLRIYKHPGTEHIWGETACHG